MDKIGGAVIFATEKTKEFYFHKTNAINQKGKENVYVITYNFKTAANILRWLYSDCNICLPRKQAKAFE